MICVLEVFLFCVSTVVQGITQGTVLRVDGVTSL